jgi:hypothetical protein
MGILQFQDVVVPSGRRFPVKRNFLSSLASAVLLAALAYPAFAHHSMSAYDQSRSVNLKATITSFDWTNPHVQIHFDARDDNGNVSSWMAECPSPNRLAKAGWSAESLKPGDEVSITGNPAKDGAKEMRLVQVALANGEQLRAYGARRSSFF